MSLGLNQSHVHPQGQGPILTSCCTASGQAAYRGFLTAVKSWGMLGQTSLPGIRNKYAWQLLIVRAVCNIPCAVSGMA